MLGKFAGTVNEGSKMHCITVVLPTCGGPMKTIVTAFVLIVFFCLMMLFSLSVKHKDKTYTACGK